MLTGSMIFLAGFLVAGFAILLYSGDCLVRGALAAALKSRVSPLLVGIVIVGFGTSLPELLIAIRSVQDGSYGLAHGNIVGSNIANVWLVIALPAIIFPVVTKAPRMRATALVMLAATAAWIAITPLMGLNPAIGAAMLAALAVYVVLASVIARRDTDKNTPQEARLERMHSWRMVVLILIGVVGLPLGAQILVESGISLARAYGLSEESVGLTLLAVGTSLPELGAGLAAAWRKESDVALGNILGSNIFNILGVGGAIALAGAQSLSPQFANYSDWAMAISAILVTLIILTHRKIGWFTGIVFLGLYAAYLYGLVRGWSFGDMRCLILECPAPV
ncbi:MAG: sodium:calcium antiporter [Alphaproteobacteria bacterium]|nr:sodium:calcium antiporter [Alphaproteobacteria bacterium]